MEPQPKNAQKNVKYYVNNIVLSQRLHFYYVDMNKQHKKYLQYNWHEICKSYFSLCENTLNYDIFQYEYWRLTSRAPADTIA